MSKSKVKRRHHSPEQKLAVLRERVRALARHDPSPGFDSNAGGSTVPTWRSARVS